jgi:DNA-3-methyladenine glycosylase II
VTVQPGGAGQPEGAGQPDGQAPSVATVTPRGPFALEASRRFLEGFGPAIGDRGSAPRGHLHLAFPVDGTDVSAGACIRQPSAAAVEIRVAGVADEVVAVAARQVERILSLDVDGTGFFDVGMRDPVVARVQSRYEGLRPVNFASPYEAAAWAIISQRIRITQASRIKTRMAVELGASIDIEGQAWPAFPTPGRLAELDGFPGLFGRKVEYLRALAVAAGAGRLDADRLRAMASDDALAAIGELDGIGPFSAQLVLLRGAGHPDVLALAEPRLRRAVMLAYDLDEEPDDDRLEAISEAWRPYRTWVAVLLRRLLEDETGEIARGRPGAAVPPKRPDRRRGSGWRR